MSVHELGLAINRMRSTFKEYDNRIIKLTLEKQDLEAKLERAVEALNLWQAYSDGLAYDDIGNHRSEKDVYEEVEKTLEEIERGQSYD